VSRVEIIATSSPGMTPRTASIRPRGSPGRPLSRAARRRWVQYALLFCTAALIVNALIGDRGLTALVKARREHARLQSALATIRYENAVLREEVVRLGSDARTIEEAARRDLGLAREDELLFIVTDVPAPPSR
jgi:cell division protein FtsB